MDSVEANRPTPAGGRAETATERDPVEPARAEDALLRANERLAFAQRAARAGVWDWDITTNQVTWSPEFSELYGMSPETPASFDGWRAALHPDDRQRAEACIRQALQERTRLVNEYRILLPGGGTRWIEALGDTSYDAEGRPLRMTGICLDITERKETAERLHDSHALLVDLARLVPGVIYQYRLYPDGRSRFPYASPGMLDIYELSPEEVRDDATPVFGRLHPDDAAFVSEAIYESARTLETFYCQFRVVLPRQGLRWRWSQAHPVRTPDGGTLWHGIILDITDRVQAEAEKAALQVQLQQAQKMESVGRLAGGVAHDFNNMLGVILGHTELMLAEVSPGSALHESLLEVHNASSRSSNLTRQLLAFARRQPIAPQVLDINDTVTRMVAMLKRLVGEDVRLEWCPEPGAWPIRVDPSQVDQLLANLCVNARDAMAGPGRVGISVTNTRVDPATAASRAGVLAGDYVRIAVSDDGNGMDADTLAHLFEPFFTTKAFGQGTGLGLATVYGIVEQNRGFIDVDSAPGRGTTIAVHLPRHTGDSARVEPAVRPARVSRGEETILVVEDEAALLGMITLVLERLGYKVLTATSAADAVRVAMATPEIRLLVTDVVMPDVNGRELAHRVAAVRPGVRVLFMSGYTADVISRQGVVDEGLTFIQKPFSIDALSRTVREILDRP